jgi:hypothetical protein
VFGAGESGSPVGAYASAGNYASSGWLDVWMIKTTGSDVDVCLAPSGSILPDFLEALNIKAAEVAAGRTWKYGRRIATAWFNALAAREFNATGNGNYTLLTAGSIGTGTVDCSVYVPPGAAGYFYGSVDHGAEDTTTSISLSEIGFAVQTTAKAQAGSNFKEFGMTTSNVRLKPDSNNQIVVSVSGGGASYAYCTAWQDLYED